MRNIFGTQTGRFESEESNVSSRPRMDNRTVLSLFGSLGGEVRLHYDMPKDELSIRARIEQGELVYDGNGVLFAQGSATLMQDYVIDMGIMSTIRKSVEAYEDRDGG